MTKDLNKSIKAGEIERRKLPLIKKDGNELKLFCIATILLLYVAAFLCETPQKLIEGMVKIIMSRDALITDYFVLAGMGTAFLNAAMVMTICVVLLIIAKIPFTGPTMAVVFINVGYGLWGKNVFNILPILLGTYIYAKLHHASFGRYIYTALFGTCMAPFISEIIYILPFSFPVNLTLSLVIGVLLGFVLPPLSMHTASMHMGYNLFNVGFAAGILIFICVCILRSLGFESETVLLWQEGRETWLVVVLYLYFGAAVLMGLIMEKGSLKGFRHILEHPGRAVADFVLMDGEGATLINMGLVAITGLTYIQATNGDLSGPVVGSIFTAFGFAAFGAHIKNYIPVLAGVFLYAFISHYQIAAPSSQLAALFAVGLGPIAGQFGVLAGIVAGMLHLAVVMCTSEMYGGLNLYNNGFSAGWVAVFMVPVVESLVRNYEDRKHKKSRKTNRK